MATSFPKLKIPGCFDFYAELERVDSGMDKLSLNKKDVLPEASAAEHHEISQEQRVWVKQYECDRDTFHASQLGEVIHNADGNSITLARVCLQPRIVEEQSGPIACPPMRPKVGNYPNPPRSQAVQSPRMQRLLSGLGRLETNLGVTEAPKPEWWMEEDELALLSPHTSKRTRFIQSAMLEAERLDMEPGDYMRQLEEVKDLSFGS